MLNRDSWCDVFSANFRVAASRTLAVHRPQFKKRPKIGNSGGIDQVIPEFPICEEIYNKKERY